MSVLICIRGEETLDVTQMKLDLAFRLVGLCASGGREVRESECLLCVHESGWICGGYMVMSKNYYFGTYCRDVLVRSCEKNVAEVLGSRDDLLFTGRFFVIRSKRFGICCVRLDRIKGREVGEDRCISMLRRVYGRYRIAA